MPRYALSLPSEFIQRCHVGIGLASVEEIDTLNIFQATMLAMARAAEALCAQIGCDPLEILIDGNLTPAGRRPEWRWPARAVVGGDATERCISAASIIAKEHRDAIMREEALRHPEYGFDRHKGYGTAGPSGGAADPWGDADPPKKFCSGRPIGTFLKALSPSSHTTRD